MSQPTLIGHERLGTDPVADTAEVLEGELFAELSRSGRRVGVAGILAPISPPNIFGIGLNYADHVRQLGGAMPDHPVVFMKPTTAIAHPGEPIVLPECCANGPEVDYECELAVVIGRTARDVGESEALNYVFGYTAANDITARHWAKSTSRTRGKSFDRFCPLGPALVTADEIPDPQCLALTTTVNGLVVQNGSTADMIFSVAELVSFLSRDSAARHCHLDRHASRIRHHQKPADIPTAGRSRLRGSGSDRPSLEPHDGERSYPVGGSLTVGPPDRSSL